MKKMFVFSLFLASVSLCFCSSQPQTLPVIVSPVNSTESGSCQSSKSGVRIEEIRALLQDQVNPFLNGRYGSILPCEGPGWTKVADIDLSDPNSECPSGWILRTDPVRTCGRNNSQNVASVTVPVGGHTYSRVCGKVIAIQRGVPEGFQRYVSTRAGLEQIYIDGISLTHGATGSRQHIWSFVVGRSETEQSSSACPCNFNSWPYIIPPYVQNNYFCESGNPTSVYIPATIYADDPLWDGERCSRTSTCCQFNGPPYFNATLPQPTSDDLEMRIMLSGSDEDVLVTMIKISIM